MVVQRLAVVGVNSLRVQIVQLRGIGRIDHDELHTVHGRVRADRLRLHAETEQQPVRPDVQIVRVAAELELTDDLRICRLGQIDRKDRVGLAVSAQIAVITVKARGEHLLSFRKAGHAADGLERVIEHIDIVARLHAVFVRLRVFKVMLLVTVDTVGIGLLGRGHTQIAITLVERELIIERTGHRAVGGKGELAVRDREAVDDRVHT